MNDKFHKSYCVPNWARMNCKAIQKICQSARIHTHSLWIDRTVNNFSLITHTKLKNSMFNCSKFLLAEFIHPVWRRWRYRRSVSPCCFCIVFFYFFALFSFASSTTVFIWFAFLFYASLTVWSVCNSHLWVRRRMNDGNAKALLCFFSLLPSTPTIKNKNG